ncbi:MAG: hypothetical protein R3344_07130 [Acidobacteriota bacterium]|nr:hypothetical protein [Acidobacteriota bacterium]
MPQLNQVVRRLVNVVDLANAPVTGLTAGSFTFTLQYHDTSDDTLDTASETVSVTEIGSGAYWITFTPTASASLYRLKIDPVSALHIVNPGEFQIRIDTGMAAAGGPYLTTRANVKTAFDIGGTDDDDRIDLLLGAVTDWAKEFCRREFFNATYTEYKHAKGAYATGLLLDEFPVSSVTTVHVSTDLPRVYDSTTLLTADEDYLVDEAAGILYRVDGSTFPQDIRSVKVVYVAGYSTVPGDLERAAIELIGVKLFKGKGKMYHLTTEQRVGEGMVQGIRFDDAPDDCLRVFERYRAHLVAA